MGTPFGSITTGMSTPDREAMEAGSGGSADVRRAKLIALFGFGYVLTTCAVSVVAFVLLRYGHCGELSSPESCDFIRGDGGPLLLIGPASVVATASIVALWRRKPLVLHLSAGAVVAAVVIIGLATLI
jgi:hypothetical protein